MRVLIISKDPTLLSNKSGFGDTLQRHIYYAERLNHHIPGSELRILTYTGRSVGGQQLSPLPNMKIFGTASLHRAMFIFDAISALRHVCSGGWRPTVLTTQGPYEEGQLGLKLARRYGARFISQLHFDLFSREWLKESYLNPFRLRIASKVMRKSDAVRVVSSEQKRNLISELGLPPSSIHVIPVSVNFKPANLHKEHCKAALDPSLRGHKVVLFAGRLYWPKNLNLWVDVARRVQASAPTTRFLIAGDGPLMGEVKGYVREQGLSSFFIFLGNVPYQELPNIYGAADVLLLTSRCESFGRVIVEANLAGLPAVSTACAGPSDIVVDGKTGYLCGLNDQDSLASRVLSLLTDEKMHDRFAESARMHAEAHFGKERLADSLINMWAAH